MGMQKKDFEGMLKRLGLNMQDFLMKNKEENQLEYRALIGQVEAGMNKNIQAITQDINDYGNKWDNEL
jgi:hypothetical protein